MNETTARNPLTAPERAHYRATWRKPRCPGCTGPLYLRVPGRTHCETCQPTNWSTLTGTDAT